MTYVDNVADAVLLALTCTDAAGQAFTIVDENVRQVDYLAAYRAGVWRALAFALPAGRAGGGRGAGARARLAPGPAAVARYTYYQVRRATDSAWYDCSRAQQVLGWTPAVSLAEGLRQSFEALRDRPTDTPGAALAARAAV